MASVAAALCLALALAWHTGLALLDNRAIRRGYPEGRVYRLGQGWVCSTRLATERRLAMVGLAAAAALIPARLAPGQWATVATLLCRGAALAFVLVERRLRGGRYTSVCLAALAAALLLEQSVTLVRGAADVVITGAFASFFAAQLYLVAGIRKIRSRHFMNGRVIVDNIAYNAYQAAAGNRDFLPIPRLPTLAILLRSPAFLLACGAAAVLTAVAELTLGLGALGLIPAPLTLALAVPIHLAFIAVSPRRIVPFSAAALGLLLLATTHPLLSPVW
jgi:hypothetical protein